MALLLEENFSSLAVGNYLLSSDVQSDHIIEAVEVHSDTGAKDAKIHLELS